MTIISTQLVSALNNYNSIVPIVTKDLVENGGRTLMAYNNAGEKTKKYEATEKFIESNATSLLWYGAIPAIKKAVDLTAFKFSKLNPDVSLELLNGKNNPQSLENVAKKIESGDLPSKFVVKKGLFKKTAQIIDSKEVLNSVKNNSLKFKGLHIGRMALSTIIPTYLTAVVLPKVIIALTQYSVDSKKGKNGNPIPSFTGNNANKNHFFADFNDFTKKKDRNKVSFGSLASVLTEKATQAQKSLLGDMVAVDLAISGSRVYYANKREKEALNGKKTKAPYAAALEKIIREGGFLYLIYFGGKHIKNAIDKVTQNKFDPLVLEDKDFVSELKSGKFKSNPIKNLSQKDALEFIDKNIDNNEQVFLKYAKKTGLIDVVENEKGKVFRNPLKFLDLKKLSSYFDEMAEGAETFIKAGGENLDKFVARKAKIKRAGVYGNLVAGSFAVCYVLPKIVYTFRKLYTGSTEEPGISKVLNKANDKNKKMV